MGFARRIDIRKRPKLGLLFAVYLSGVAAVLHADDEAAMEADGRAESITEYLRTHHDHPQSFQPLVDWYLPAALWQKPLTLQTTYLEKPEALLTPESVRKLGHSHSLLKFEMAAPLFDRFLSSAGEFSYSFLPHEMRDGLGDPRHRLARLRFFGTSQNFKYGAEFRSVGKQFSNVSGPRFTPDREGGEAWTETHFGALRLRANLQSFWDNLEHDRSRSQLTRSQGTVTAYFRQPPWPSLRLAYAKKFETSGREPDGVARHESSSDVWESSIEKPFSHWRPSVTSTVSVTRNRSHPDSSISHRHRIAASYRPLKIWELTPSFTWEEKQDPSDPSSAFTTGFLNRFYDPNLGVRWTTTAFFNRRFARLASNDKREFQLKSSLSWLLNTLPANPDRVSLLFDYRREHQRTVDKSETFSVWLAVKLNF